MCPSGMCRTHPSKYGQRADENVEFRKGLSGLCGMSQGRKELGLENDQVVVMQII